MTISIAIHKENIPIIKSYLEQKCKQENNNDFGYTCDFDCDQIHVNTNIDIFNFIAVEFLEEYTHSALYTNLFFFPKSEKFNKKLLKTIMVNTRPVDCTGLIVMPNIFPYSEDSYIKYMKKRIGD